MHFQHRISDIVINIINVILTSILILKKLRLLENKIIILYKLAMICWKYTKITIPCLSSTVFCCCGNILEKRKLMYLIKQRFYVHFFKPIFDKVYNFAYHYMPGIYTEILVSQKLNCYFETLFLLGILLRTSNGSFWGVAFSVTFFEKVFNWFKNVFRVSRILSLISITE